MHRVMHGVLDVIELVVLAVVLIPSVFQLLQEL